MDFHGFSKGFWLNGNYKDSKIYEPHLLTLGDTSHQEKCASLETNEAVENAIDLVERRLGG